MSLAPSVPVEGFDFDPPRERCALLSWSAASGWSVVGAGSSSRHLELQDLGALLFGAPPWRRATVIRVLGRLGSIEAAAAALPAPGPDFLYSFEFSGFGKLPPVPVRRQSVKAAPRPPQGLLL